MKPQAQSPRSKVQSPSARRVSDFGLWALNFGPIAVLLILSSTATGCGYHLAGKGARLPAHVKTIAIPAFKNETSRFKVEQVLTQAVIREFLARTRFRVQPEMAGSDAVLTGTVIQFWTTPAVVEPSAGRAISVSIALRARVKLTDNRTGATLYENPDYLFTETYEISGDAATYFEESGPAIERLSRSFAAALVSAILEAF